MKLALFDDYRLGVLRGDEALVDVSAALPHWDNGYIERIGKITLHVKRGAQADGHR